MITYNKRQDCRCPCGGNRFCTPSNLHEDISERLVSQQPAHSFPKSCSRLGLLIAETSIIILLLLVFHESSAHPQAQVAVNLKARLSIFAPGISQA